jgi:hypothetical protein
MKRGVEGPNRGLSVAASILPALSVSCWLLLGASRGGWQGAPYAAWGWFDASGPALPKAFGLEAATRRTTWDTADSHVISHGRRRRGTQVAQSDRASRLVAIDASKSRIRSEREASAGGWRTTRERRCACACAGRGSWRGPRPCHWGAVGRHTRGAALPPGGIRFQDIGTRAVAFC